MREYWSRDWWSHVGWAHKIVQVIVGSNYPVKVPGFKISETDTKVKRAVGFSDMVVFAGVRFAEIRVIVLRPVEPSYPTADPVLLKDTAEARG